MWPALKEAFASWALLVCSGHRPLGMGLGARAEGLHSLTPLRRPEACELPSGVRPGDLLCRKLDRRTDYFSHRDRIIELPTRMSESPPQEHTCLRLTWLKLECLGAVLGAMENWMSLGSVDQSKRKTSQPCRVLGNKFSMPPRVNSHFQASGPYN